MNGQNIIICKKCGSNKVNRFPTALVLFVSAGCLAWIPILGWIAAPILLILSFIAMFSKITMKCEECKHTFMVDKNTYKKYKNYLNS